MTNSAIQLMQIDIKPFGQFIQKLVREELEKNCSYTLRGKRVLYSCRGFKAFKCQSNHFIPLE